MRSFKKTVCVAKTLHLNAVRTFLLYVRQHGQQERKKREERMSNSSPIPEGKRDTASTLLDTVFTPTTFSHLKRLLIRIS